MSQLNELPRSVKPWVRLIILFVGLTALCLVSLITTGSIFPPNNQAANIFQGGLLLVILGSLFLEDKFTRPADAMVNALTGVISLITVYPNQAGVAWWSIFAYCVIPFSTGAVCIALGVPGESRGTRARISHALYVIATTLGKSNILFSVVFLHAVFAFYGLQSWQTAALVVFWGLYVVIWPLKLANILQALLDKSRVPNRCGFILRMETPNIMRVELLPDAKWDSNTSISACTGDGRQRLVLPLFVQVQNEALVGTGLCLGECQSPVHRAIRGQVYALDSRQEDVEESLCDYFELNSASLPLGLVSEDSRIGKINFETWRPEECREGLLVFCQVNGERVFYQITEGNTREEILAKNRHGFQVAEASQLGTIEDGKRFLKYPWVPAMHTPVFAAREQPDIPEPDLAPDEFILGKVPGSSVSVVASIDDILTYHTAILGITGTGKTELAYDLVREAVARSIKVFCVDLTRLYGDRLTDLDPRELSIDEDIADKLGEKLFDVETGEWRAQKEKKVFQQFEVSLRQDIIQRVNSFLDSNNDYVGLFNLPTISNTKTTILVTEMYLSSIFQYAREHPEKDPILVVLEEAHTVVPESTTMGLGDFESKAMVAKIAQIALQGRKYHVGLLVIAQRTATVSKTVLTQCNTIISFSCFDQTSLDFLTNFFGKDHASLVPNLEFLHAIVFGKGIRSQRPLIVEIPYDERKRQAGPEEGVDPNRPLEPEQPPFAPQDPHFSEEELIAIEQELPF
jgi:hypothetical protein